MDWAQLLNVVVGGAASGALLRQLLSHRRYVLKHRVLKAVIERENSTPEQWQAAADALDTIDGRPGLRRPVGLPRRAERRQLRDDPSIPSQRSVERR